MAEATRVALLARPGTACENLQAALRQAGAELVHVGDPTGGDAAALAASDPGAVLVALEPAVESALDAFDAILQDPARIVIYDEAELAAVREGWDAARWVRHLSAKLGGHSDVLPPGREMEAAMPAAADAPMSIDEPDLAEPAPVDQAVEWPSMDLVEADPAPEPAATRAVTIEYGGGASLLDATTLELVDDGDDAPAAPQPAIEPEAEPEAEIAQDAPGTMDAGGAVLLSGIGGPDAVRQFLGALPERFPRPVLVRQRLDGGRHDRLVRQLQRATSLPVELAESGAPLAAGHVYILPDGMTTEDTDSGRRFAESAGTVGALAGLPPGDSAIVLLSGADPALVDEVMQLAGAGALVAGQSPEECFDNAAPAAAIAHGAEPGSPALLAGRVAGRWNP